MSVDLIIHPRASNSAFVEITGFLEKEIPRLVRLTVHEGVLNVAVMTDETSTGKVLSSIVLEYDGTVHVRSARKTFVARIFKGEVYREE
jgi:hypothetical protein